MLPSSCLIHLCFNWNVFIIMLFNKCQELLLLPLKLSLRSSFVFFSCLLHLLNPYSVLNKPVKLKDL